MSNAFAHVDVVIIGAGLAGLSAAKTLAENDKSFVVLEANSRLGGRIHTEQFDAGPDTPAYWIDQGAQWVGKPQEHINQLIEQFGLGTIDGLPQSGKALLFFQKQRFELSLGSLDDELCSLMKTPINALRTHHKADIEEFEQALGKLNAISQTFVAGYPWRAEQAKYLDSQTVESWMQQNIESPAARFLLRLNVMLAFASLPNDLSLLHFVHYIRSCGGIKCLLQAQGKRLKQGASSIVDALGQALNQHTVDCIHLDTEIRDVVYTEDDSIIAIAGDGRQFEGKHLIVAVPPAVMSKIRFTQPHPDEILHDFQTEQLLSAARIQLNQRMPMGSTIKFHVVYKQPFWREYGYSGIVASDKHPLAYLVDNSNTQGHYDESDGVGIIGGFFDIEFARNHLNTPVNELEKCIANGIDEIYSEVLDFVPKPIAVHVQRWADEPWAGGCYAGIMPTGVWTSFKGTLRQSVGPLHFASTETAKTWTAFMDGAISAGINAAREILD